MDIKSPVVEVLDVQEMPHKESLFTLFDSRFLHSNVKTEQQVEERYILLSDASYNSRVYARHNHRVKEVFIDSELFLASTRSVHILLIVMASASISTLLVVFHTIYGVSI